MAQGIIGQRAGNAIIPYDGSRKQTEWITLGTGAGEEDRFENIATFDNVATASSAAYIKFEEDSEGHVRLYFEGHIYSTNPSQVDWEWGIENVSMSSGEPNPQVIGIWYSGNNANSQNVATIFGNNSFKMYGTNTSRTDYWVNFETVVDSIPDWALPYLETTGADNYIQPASSTVPGLVGGSEGVAVAAGNVGEVKTTGAANVALTGSSSWQNVSSLTLEKGIWHIFAGSTALNAAATVWTDDYGICINTDNNNSSGCIIGYDLNSTEPLNDTGNRNTISLNVSHIANITDASDVYYLNHIGYYTGDAPTSRTCMYAVRIG